MYRRRQSEKRITRKDEGKEGRAWGGKRHGAHVAERGESESENSKGKCAKTPSEHLSRHSREQRQTEERAEQ